MRAPGFGKLPYEHSDDVYLYIYIHIFLVCLFLYSFMYVSCMYIHTVLFYMVYNIKYIVYDNQSSPEGSDRPPSPTRGGFRVLL